MSMHIKHKLGYYNFLLLFCKKNKKKLLFLGRASSVQKTEKTIKKKILYYKYKNKDKNFNIKFFDKTKFENIKHLLQSEVAGIGSTLVRESFGLKKKVLACMTG